MPNERLREPREWLWLERCIHTLNSLHIIEVDGFLNGIVTVREGNARGVLYLWCGPDRNRVIEKPDDLSRGRGGRCASRHGGGAPDNQQIYSVRIDDTASSERLCLLSGSGSSLGEPRAQGGDGGSVVEPRFARCVIMPRAFGSALHANR